MQILIQKGIISPVSVNKNDCGPCSEGKFRRSFRGSLSKANSPGYIHADVGGRINPQSRDGYDCFLTVVDENSRYTEVYLLEKKSEASQKLITFMKRFERLSGIQVKSLHSDRGSEFAKAKSSFTNEGVEVTTSTPYTPSSNGLVERTQGTLLSLARTCLVESKLPYSYWSDAIRHVAQARKIVMHSATGESPQLKLFKSNPIYAKHMRPFGCRVRFQPNAPKKNKFSARLVEGINLGHVGGGMYRVLTAEKVTVTKHVKFFEREFPCTPLLYGMEGTVDVPEGSDSSNPEGYKFFEESDNSSDDDSSSSDSNISRNDSDDQHDAETGL